jgi:hypothetical protein
VKVEPVLKSVALPHAKSILVIAEVERYKPTRAVTASEEELALIKQVLLVVVLE